MRRPMPSSRRMSLHAAMAAAAHLYSSLPLSKKRSTRPKSCSGDSRRSPSPNPRSGRNHRGSASFHKSEGKRKSCSFVDSNPLALSLTTPASSSVGRIGTGAVQKLWTDANEVVLLTGAISFRARTGGAPRLPDMGALFDSLRDSLSPHLTQAKMYYKLKQLKRKFFNSTPATIRGPHELRLRDLSAELWGTELTPLAEVSTDIEKGDTHERYIGGDVAMPMRLPVVSEMLSEYWGRNGRTLSLVSLEKGLALLEAKKAMAVETKWRRQLDAEIRTQLRRHDLAKEVYGLVIDAIKGLGP